MIDALEDLVDKKNIPKLIAALQAADEEMEE